MAGFRGLLSARKLSVNALMIFPYTPPPPEELKEKIDYYQEKEGYLQAQIGNPEGEDQPNKKYYDPRVWLRKGEESFKARLKQAFEDLNNVGTLA